jgi:hypothetical protein
VKQALVVGMHKTGTTIVSSVIQHSIPEGRFFIEPRTVAFFEKLGKHDAPGVVKIIYEHWMARPSLLTGIVRGETRFRPDKVVAIVRDPRDGLISGLMYRVYECVLQGATRDQVDKWVEVVREKEAAPDRYSIVGLVRIFNGIFGIDEPPESGFDTFAHYSGWLERNRDCLHVLRYEDFVGVETAALQTYLGVPLSLSREVDPSLQRVARTRQSGSWRTMMLPDDVAYFRDRYGGVLERWTYGDWTTRPEKSPAREGSGYILRIADEAFKSRASDATPAGIRASNALERPADRVS